MLNDSNIHMYVDDHVCPWNSRDLPAEKKIWSNFCFIFKIQNSLLIMPASSFYFNIFFDKSYNEVLISQIYWLFYWGKIVRGEFDEVGSGSGLFNKGRVRIWTRFISTLSDPVRLQVNSNQIHTLPKKLPLHGSGKYLSRLFTTRLSVDLLCSVRLKSCIFFPKQRSWLYNSLFP